VTRWSGHWRPRADVQAEGGIATGAGANRLAGLEQMTANHTRLVALVQSQASALRMTQRPWPQLLHGACIYPA